MQQIFGVHGIPQVVHADRGTSMTSKTVAALLGRPGRHPLALPAPRVQRQPLLRGVVQDPEVRPGLPATASASLARRPRLHGPSSCTTYNHEHHHSRHRPAHPRRRPLRPRRRHGTAREPATLATARAAHPERFTTTTDPKILDLPTAAWINQARTTEQATSRLTPTGLNHLDKFRGRPETQTLRNGDPRTARGVAHRVALSHLYDDPRGEAGALRQSRPSPVARRSRAPGPEGPRTWGFAQIWPERHRARSGAPPARQQLWTHLLEPHHRSGSPPLHRGGSAGPRMSLERQAPELPQSI